MQIGANNIFYCKIKKRMKHIVDTRLSHWWSIDANEGVTFKLITMRAGWLLWECYECQSSHYFSSSHLHQRRTPRHTSPRPVAYPCRPGAYPYREWRILHRSDSTLHPLQWVSALHPLPWGSTFPLDRPRPVTLTGPRTWTSPSFRMCLRTALPRERTLRLAPTLTLTTWRDDSRSSRNGNNSLAAGVGHITFDFRHLHV